MKAIAAALMLVMAGVASADDAGVAAAIGKVRAERAALKYREAFARIEATLAMGKASPAQLAELYRMAGELAAGLDEPDRAEYWFARWLTLVPDGRLGGDASPKVRSPLEAARVSLGGQTLAIAVSPAASAGTVSIAVTGDPMRVVRSVRVRDARSVVTEGGLPGASLSIAEIEGDALVAAALDELGNELVVLPFERPGTEVGGGGESGRGRGTGTGTGERAMYARWQTWAGGTVVLAVAGGVFAWRMGVAQDEFDRLGEDGMHTFDELEDVRARGERHALFANVAFGAAAATAVVTVVLVVRGNRVAPVVGADHAGVALAGSF